MGSTPSAALRKLAYEKRLRVWGVLVRIVHLTLVVGFFVA